DLCCIVRGEGMCSPKVTPGTAGAFGGVTKRLKGLGIPVACCADGPSGIRMDCGSIAFAMPNGTCLGSTFNEALSEELFEWEGLELRKNKIDTLLGPGINLHRNPLNGRNFEYFSEDPLLTGRMAAAQLRAMGRYDVTGTIKHFACNSQESGRNVVEAVVSERALRELYLKGFEIAVKEGGAYSIMTSYNPVNGFWSASNYDMLTTILRGDWGYEGIVMTDWWAKGNDEGSAGKVENVAAMVRAQNDLFMVTANAGENSQNDNSMESLTKGSVTRGEYLRSAANICRYLLRTPAYQRLEGRESELDRQLAAVAAQEMEAFGDMARIPVTEEVTLLPVDQIKTGKGCSITFELNVRERGNYRLELDCRVTGQGSLAQVPLTLSQDKQIVKTISLTGEDKEWRTEEIMVRPSFHNTTFLKFFFGQGGMEIREARLVLVESMEAKFAAWKASQTEEKE
ncbi:MAG: beta-glucosidase, partial [Lachnospiraceae bacterium]|nr:beta-glucosidase [Lachnospiraceae bacterium]